LAYELEIGMDFARFKISNSFADCSDPRVHFCLIIFVCALTYFILEYYSNNIQIITYQNYIRFSLARSAVPLCSMSRFRVSDRHIDLQSRSLQATPPTTSSCLDRRLCGTICRTAAAGACCPNTSHCPCNHVSTFPPAQPLATCASVCQPARVHQGACPTQPEHAPSSSAALPDLPRARARPPSPLQPPRHTVCSPACPRAATAPRAGHYRAPARSYSDPRGSLLRARAPARPRAREPRPRPAQRVTTATSAALLLQ
jgi:hypothetical protein